MKRKSQLLRRTQVLLAGTLATILVIGLGLGARGSDAPPGRGTSYADATATIAALLTSIAELEVTMTAEAPTTTPTRTVATNKPTPAPAATRRPITPMAELVVAALNIRRGPGTSFEIIDSAVQGQQFIITGQSGGCAWLQVVLKDGSAGWISGLPAYATLNVPCSRLPAAAGPAVAQAAPTRTARPTPTPHAAQAPAPSAAPASEPKNNLSSGDSGRVTTGGPTSVRIVSPLDRTSTASPALFAWEPNAALGEGQVYELGFWQPIETEREARSWTPAGKDTQIVINPKDHPGDYRWGIWLGMFDAEGRYSRIRYLGGGYTFNVPHLHSPPVPAPGSTPGAGSDGGSGGNSDYGKDG